VSHGRLPKLHFPMFNGEDRQLWMSRCENYFATYGVESSLWVQVASKHVEGTPAHCLQYAECNLKHASWT
jgi:hypothetical protein